MPTRTRSIRTATAPSRNNNNTVSVRKDALNKVLVLSVDNLADSLDCYTSTSEIRRIFEEARAIRAFARNHGISNEFDTQVRRSMSVIFDECDWSADSYMSADQVG